MSSVVLSFVGNQDPFAATETEGSIISLLRFLLNQGTTIKKVVLLHTEGTAKNAQDTQEHMESESQLSGLVVELIPTSWELSKDPTDLWLAAQEAKRGLEWVQSQLEPGDRVDFNASSGTPAMKSAFSLLQAAGYASNSQIWQVRNPKEMKPGQDRVFPTNVLALRQEFDRKRIEQQIADYNYSGAWLELTASQLATDRLKGLLEYARCRKAFDFNGASDAIQELAGAIDDRWAKDIAKLRSGHKPTVLAEAYFNAVLSLHNRDYFTVFTRVFGIQENVLKYAIGQLAEFPKDEADTDRFWQEVKALKSGEVYRALEKAAPKNRAVRTSYFPNRLTMRLILDCDPDSKELLGDLDKIEKLCADRNQMVHEFKGISRMENPEEVLNQLRRILKGIVTVSLTDNPFDRLNAEIRSALTS
ncbi:hypothetical protein H6G52_14025 [Limnothrix sp. FACHB-881]|uniref:CRISPR-associated protein n=1 Tax=Limnothrix redekei LRLZ20PSL1 TaxID=3112953 RepID=A0ABW7C6T1_9CYAN|nr:hypothetical protein [Limnothrix sp. FACHB-881]MBD2636483.1 hypothetical protein [Limnothrix sp. FACHB-881]